MKILKKSLFLIFPLKTEFGFNSNHFDPVAYRKKEKLEKRFETSKTIVGTKKYHCFVPIDNKKMRVKRFSKYCVDIQ